jgi:hypothetical protein
MEEPIEVFLEIRNGVPTDARTSRATEVGIKLTVIQVSEDDSEADTAEAEALIEAACERCPNFLDW